MRFSKIFTVVYLLSVSCPSAWKGFVKVSGRFLCNGEPWRNEKVSVYLTGFWAPHPFLVSNLTDSNGGFYLVGLGDDTYPLRPYIYMPNYCNAVEFLDRQWARHLRIQVPHFYVDMNPKLLELGEIELNEASTDQVGFQKLTDWIKNFAESRPIRRRKIWKMSEM